jgi:hypothetical protein
VLLDILGGGARYRRGQCGRRTIAEAKQLLSVIGCVIKNLLSRVPPCFGGHVKPLVPAAFAVVSTHQPALAPRGSLWPVLLMYNPLGRPVLVPGSVFR